jgi:transcriptional regulator with XRE-family HTH domain
MIQPVEDLADFMRRMRSEAGLSIRQVAKRSGGGISHGYVNQIENRSVLGSSVSPARLIAIARGLGISEDALFAVARGKPLKEIEAMQSQLLAFFGQLPTERQEDVLRLTKALHQAHSTKPTSIKKQEPKKKRVA